ncbi:MAG: AAA family ATPase [Hyphomicrobiaceae bacterium]|nr:AAA family ATPase [Hyphomicrobiaceae bacterium]
MPHLAGDMPPELEAEIIALLEGDVLAGPVRRIDTHGARVFVGQRETLKIKRPVAYSYMNFSTAEKRRRACLREVEINRGNAPELYLGVDRITREPDGTLAINGRGSPVEHAVRLKTFNPEDGFDRIVAREALDGRLAVALGDVVAWAHERAPEAEPNRGRTISEMRVRLVGSAQSRRAVFGESAVKTYAARSAQQLARVEFLLAQRRQAGAVKRCHGDLHLGNIVLWRGAPTLFDAIEFDEDLATIDPMYDLAFLLMDLVHRGQRAAGTLVLNRYLWRLGDAAVGDRTWEMLAALPLLIALRASVRAVVGIDRATDLTGVAKEEAEAEARAYLATANAALTPKRARLVAVGGLSGTGKSTLAGALAPELGAMPGSIHLRSDMERKRLAGVEPETRLGPTGYVPEMTTRTYATLHEKARIALRAGHSVIVDAVFSTTEERADIAALAAAVGVPFVGLWLEAPTEVKRARVAARKGDASDATVDVVDRQITRGVGTMTWHVVDASGDVAATRAQALERVAASDGPTN